MVWSDENERVTQLLETEWLDLADIRHPALVAVYEHWNAVRGGNFAPSLRQFRLEDLAPEIVPSMVIIDFIGPPLDFHYRFFGSKMVETSGMELTGKSYFADNVKGYGFVNAEIFPKVIEARRPLCTRSTWKSVKSITKFTTTIRFPVSADGKTVTNGVTVNHFDSAD